MLARASALVEPLGGLGDGLADAAGRGVARHGQRVALPALPRLTQRVRQQRQGARLALDVAHQQVDEAGFEPQPGLRGGALDGARRSASSIGAEEVEAPLDEARELGVGGQVAEPVGPQRDDEQRRPRSATATRGGEELATARGESWSQGERLLALVHDEHVGAAESAPRRACPRVGPGRDDRDPPAVAFQRGGDPGPDQRGLAASRGPDHDQDAGLVSRRRQAAMSASRPKKASASPTS